MRRTLVSALIACLALVAVLAPSASASGGGTVRTISLHPTVSFPNATGKAVYKVDGTKRELEVELQGIRALAGKHVNVFVNGNKWVSPIVGALGRFDIERSTEKGQFVPTIRAGSLVRVRTLGGTLIAGGSF